MSKRQQKISKLISYWLRHNPQEADIQLDQFGWAQLENVINALHSNHFEYTVEQLIELNNSFDKVRWKIDLDGQKIKATHGHSIAIEQELISETPNEILYHGTASKNIIGIIKNGLLSQQRQYVHLSDSIEMAREIGKRHGKPFIIEINTPELIENGWEFFKTEENVWLTSDIPSKYLTFNPWRFDMNQNNDQSIKSELKKEVHRSHQLYGKLEKLKMIGFHLPDDDRLFMDLEKEDVYVIHPTWSGKKETGVCPSTDRYENLEVWIKQRLILDHDDWYM